MKKNGNHKKPSKWELDFIEATQNLLIRRLKFALYLVIGIFIFDAIFQIIVKPSLFYSIIWDRLLILAIAFIILGLCYLKKAAKYAFIISIFTVIAVVADIQFAIHISGGYNSYFQAGLSLLLVASCLLLPYSILQTGLICLIMWVAFLLPAIINRNAAVHQSGFSVNILLLFCASIISITAGGNAAILRKNEFFSTKALDEEQKISNQLLLNILPEAIADRLKDGEEIISDSFDEVTILFADIVGFTKFSESLKPQDLVEILNYLFTDFDELTEQYKIEKIKTIGDAYMAVAGIPIVIDNHAEIIADYAIEMFKKLEEFNRNNHINLQLRIGINTGTAVAGIIGKKKFTYDLWGDCVNTASRMESNGIPGEIQVTENTYNLLKTKYKFKERGNIEVKGKGKMKTYFLLGRA